MVLYLVLKPKTDKEKNLQHKLTLNYNCIMYILYIFTDDNMLE